MRKLDRVVCPTPPCLDGYQQGAHSWDDVTPDHRAEIRTHLEEMQGRRCAYCEGDIDTLGQHIEHFRRKGDPAYRHLTFDWSNLFWSCHQEDTCGRFKDNRAGAFNASDLIDPCADDPDSFFIFQVDGTISIRHGLSPTDQHRAKETLRVFSLDAEWGRCAPCERSRCPDMLMTPIRLSTKVGRPKIFARTSLKSLSMRASCHFALPSGMC